MLWSIAAYFGSWILSLAAAKFFHHLSINNVLVVGFLVWLIDSAIYYWFMVMRQRRASMYQLAIVFIIKALFWRFFFIETATGALKISIAAVAYLASIDQAVAVACGNEFGDLAFAVLAHRYCKSRT